MPTTLGVVYGANSSAGTRILQIATLSNVYSAARLAAPVGTITDVSADPRQMGNLGLRRFRCRSGHPMLREATADIVKSWKFKLPNLFRTEWKYDTIFKYHLSGKELESNETAKLTIVVESFHRIDVMSDSGKPEMQVSY
jgi:hypothetical protein